MVTLKVRARHFFPFRSYYRTVMDRRDKTIISWTLKLLKKAMLFDLFFNTTWMRKVHIFWEGHTILRNLHCRFDCHYIGQIYGGDIAKFFGLLRIYELYEKSLWEFWISLNYRWFFLGTKFKSTGIICQQQCNALLRNWPVLFWIET